MLGWLKGWEKSKNKSQSEPIKTEGCPYLTRSGGCDIQITKNYFIRLCTKSTYINCHYYNKKRDELKTPIGWLQSEAIKTAL